MVPALEISVDLVGITVALLGMALAAAVLGLFKPLVAWIRGHTTISLPIVGSVSLFGWLADGIESTIVSGAQSIYNASDQLLHACLFGLTESFKLLVDDAATWGGWIKAALTYLWDSALKPTIHAITDPIRTLATKASAEVTALGKTVAADLTKVGSYAEARATAALNTAEAFTRTEVSAARTDALRAEQAITARLDGIAAQGESLVGDVTALPGEVWGDLKKYANPTNLADLILLGSIAGLAVNTLATDTGLTNAECRGKVKQICGTDPSQWAKLLEGLALIGLAFNLRELAAFAETLVDTVKPIVEQAAK